MLARAPLSYISFDYSVDCDSLTVPVRRKLPTSGNGYAFTCILSVLLVNLTALLKASWSIRLKIMGRREQQEKERNRAAASCCSLDYFLPNPSKKKTCTAAITSPVIEPEPAIPFAATNNEDTNEVEYCDEVTPSGARLQKGVMSLCQAWRMRNLTKYIMPIDAAVHTRKQTEHFLK